MRIENSTRGRRRRPSRAPRPLRGATRETTEQKPLELAQWWVEELPTTQAPSQRPSRLLSLATWTGVLAFSILSWIGLIFVGDQLIAYFS